MLLYYHKDPLGNFGDDLNPWLWGRVFPGLFEGEVYHDPGHRGYVPGDAQLFVGIGTLLNQRIPGSCKKIVFGSGAGYGKLPNIDASWDVAFVRGPLTAKCLSLEPRLAVIDPAILAVDYAEQIKNNGQSMAYMPHCASARQHDWRVLCDDANLRFIDPQWPVEKVITEIQASSVLLTEALHGAILAESFRIPWAPVRSSPGVLDFKWNDWCASIGRVYDPYNLPPLWKCETSLFSKMKSSLKTSYVLHEIRKLVKYNKATLAPEKTLSNAKSRLYDEIGLLTEKLQKNIRLNF